MEALYLFATMAGLWRFAVDGRAVNISTSWFLPEEGSPVFYRYFDDKVTWNEAHAACGSLHADLLSVQTTAQLDAARAYLREINVADNVWIGLQREFPDEPFSWTNGEQLLGDGYWVEPIPKSAEKLCVAIDPAGDFRWSSHYCRGPEVASFVCELGVPEWARREKGCLMSPLPSLTVTLIPEAAVIQLLSDCGLDGTRRIACNEKTSSEEVIKHLSCHVDVFASTARTGSTTGDAARQTNYLFNSHSATGSYHPLTRHRRSAPFASPPTTRPPPNKPLFPPNTQHLSHPSTPQPQTSLSSSSPTPTTLPLLPITDHPSPPPVVLLINHENLHGPFPFPLADDDVVLNPSPSPLHNISVDLVEFDNNLTANNTHRDLTTPVALPESSAPPPIKLHHSPLPPTTPKQGSASTGEELPDDPDPPQRHPRGRLFPHPTRSSYPRLLNRLLG